MITSYEIKEIKNEKVVILHLDFSLEVGSFDSKEKENFLSTVKQYIKKLNIKENYKKILIMSGSIVVATLLMVNNDIRWLNGLNETNNLNSNNIVDIEPQSYAQNESIIIPEQEEDNQLIDDKKDDVVDSNISEQIKDSLDIENNFINNQVEKDDDSKEEISNENNIFTKNEHVDSNHSESELSSETMNEENKGQMVTIHRNNGTILKIELEEYIVGVVAAEMPASFSIEALKAQAVVARTYALKKVSNGEKLTDTVSTQAYIDIAQMKTKWGSDFSKYYNKIVSAVSETKGQTITYQGKYINAVYHSTSNGYTEDAINVWGESYPYLKSVESSWDKAVSSYERTITKDFQNLLDITGLQADDSLEIKILSRNASGRVESVRVGDNVYTGIEFRNLLGLRSADFDIEIVDDNIEITTRGYGHGVGMSQYGANEMAKAGYNYNQIIKHYYMGVQIQK